MTHADLNKQLETIEALRTKRDSLKKELDSLEPEVSAGGAIGIAIFLMGPIAGIALLFIAGILGLWVILGSLLLGVIVIKLSSLPCVYDE